MSDDRYNGEIIDVHNHLITPAAMRAISEQVETKKFKTFDSRFHVSSAPDFSGEDTAAEITARWISRMDELGISRIVWFPFKGFHEDVFEARRLHPDRIIPFVWIDMKDPVASLPVLEKGVEHHGVKGIKINPAADHVHPHDKVMEPVWEYMDAKGLAVVSHYGISMAPDTDMRYIDPTNVQPVAMAYPNVNFIVAHMGAGFVKECLFLMYHDFNENIFFDCSGSGAWLKYLPFETTFEKVYARFIDAGGVERILFGSDSNLRGYRGDILDQNLAIFKNLGLAPGDVEKIMAGNARRVLRV